MPAISLLLAGTLMRVLLSILTLESYGVAMTYGAGVPIAISQKQKLNTRSSTEAELVGVDDGVNVILWTKLFLEAQGCTIKVNTVFQDNQSAILLEVNGKRSSRTMRYPE